MSELRRRPTHSKGNGSSTSVLDKSHIGDSNDKDKCISVNSLSVWHLVLIFITILIPRTISCFYHPIMDCDETYNYWEPTHLLQYTYGLQTWEYSPVYALRSYLYVGIHAVAGCAIQLFTSNKINVFYGIRTLLAIISALCDTILIKSISTVYNTNKQISFTLVYCTTIFLSLSSGMQHASMSYLPSSFTMYTITLAMSYWIQSRYNLVIVWIGVSVLFGWPFSAVLAVLPAVDIVINQYKQLPKLMLYGVLTVCIVVVPSILVDYVMYNKYVVAVLNIVLYNGAGGADLYGTESVAFYINNLLLNFNIVFILSIFSLPTVFINIISHDSIQRQSHVQSMKLIVSMYVWVVLMSMMAHKEERFIYIVYPLICYSAAYTVTYAYNILLLIINTVASTTIQPTRLLNTVSTVVIVLVFAVLSISRTALLIDAYNAPLHIYTYLYNNINTLGDSTHNICVGKEWYRFPSHYFLNDHQRLQFIKSGFNGQLPQMYHQLQSSDISNNTSHIQRLIDSTSTIPLYMNNMNYEEHTRYIQPYQCDFIIDTEFKQHKFNPDEHWYTYLKPLPQHNKPECVDIYTFTNIYSIPFLDSISTRQPYRSFYLPFIQQQNSVYGQYNIFQRETQTHCNKPSITY